MPYPVDDVAHGSNPAELVRDEHGLALRTPDGVTVRAAVEYLSAPRPGRDLLGRAVKDALRGSRKKAGDHQRPRAGTGGGRPAEMGYAMNYEQVAEVVDATAGLGADSFHLAALGLRVTMLERVPQVAALLEDALARAAAGELGAAARASAANLVLHTGDAGAWLTARAAEGQRPAVVLLDPMYPKQSKAALPSKGMALFREMVGEDADAPGLLEVALRSATRRVVVKRPIKAPYLGGLRPAGSLEGRTTRYDLYAPVVGP